MMILNAMWDFWDTENNNKKNWKNETENKEKEIEL